MQAIASLRPDYHLYPCSTVALPITRVQTEKSFFRHLLMEGDARGILVWTLFYLRRRKCWRLKKISELERKWNLILISNLNILLTRINIFSVYGNDTVFQLLSLTLFCSVSPLGVFWGSSQPLFNLLSPRISSSDARASTRGGPRQHELVVARSSSPTLHPVPLPRHLPVWKQSWPLPFSPSSPSKSPLLPHCYF